jgi:TonB-dependent SusC/RagA subfamily outer membrane receptor
MRYLSAFCSCLLSFGALAQPARETAGIAIDKKDSSAVIKFRCHARATLNGNTEPLIVVDGIPVEMEVFRNMNVAGIKNIDILKDPEASALYGSKGVNGVILIRTRTFNSRKFIVRDLLNREKLPGATILFKSKDHTFMTVANDSGMVITDQLMAGKNYEIEVTMTGYKEAGPVFSSRSFEQTIFLERNTKDCPEVIVVAYPWTGCRGITGNWQKVPDYRVLILDSAFKEQVKDEPSISNIYPNPARKGQTVTIELKNETDKPVQVKIFSLNGQLLLSQYQKSFKNGNRVVVQTDSRWSAGVYIVQLLDSGGKCVHTGKLVIQ